MLHLRKCGIRQAVTIACDVGCKRETLAARLNSPSNAAISAPRSASGEGATRIVVTQS
ncbi:hypothetical protein ACVIW2_007578 [Bradyrhizobium huanghuaihaiense]|uniref:hypothetical protein n=1 Tax=Bradyrhizobium huanghuaihaiense TaxID=990078 RepID=UPI00036CAEDD|nr:hypothetical protein [Bradyrhizobium huanghuaihaiense]